jgi:hypothetical protein
MRTQNRPFRLTASAAIAAMVLAQALPQRVLAQGAPPPPPQAGVPDQAQSGDPPATVGRLAQLNGTVSFHPPDDQQWSAAKLNYPVTQGDAFWTEPNARAVIEVTASRVAMAPATELDIGSLTSSAFQAVTPEGELYLDGHTATPDESDVVQTPRASIRFAAPGRYGVVAGDTQNPTTVTVIEGSARIEGPGVSLDVGPDQTATITGTDTFQGEVGPAQRDAFLTAMLNSERPPPPQGAAPPAAVATMPGADDLAEYGSWSDSTEYGQVWYPQVAPDWVPYREGSWDYVAPWGWTWVDSEPWGFAPFHYGRWADVGGRWAWVPGGAVAAPVYAPALVTFLGVGAVVGVGIGAALAAGRIGWCPLGPHEAYHPWYRASDRYFRQVNVSHVTNFNTINRNVSFNNFVNRGATTVVPTSTMTASRRVAGSFQHLDPAQLAQVRPVIGAQPLRPTSTTVGVTPAVARQLNMPPPAAGLRPISPGPVIRGTPAAATGFATGAVTGRPGLPTLHNPASPGAVPAAAGVHPFSAPPGLRTPPAPGQVGPPTINHGPVAVSPGAIVHEPPVINRGGVTPPGTITRVPPVTTVQQAAPPGDVHAPLRHTVPPPPVGQTAPPVVAHTPPPPPAVVRAPPPPPVVHTPPPPVVVHAAPPPPVRAAPNPTPQFRAPPPVVHNPPPPPQNEQRKRPGEP